MNDPIVLSEAGMSRRADVLHELDFVMKRRNQIRAARKISLAILVIGAAPALAWLAFHRPAAPFSVPPLPVNPPSLAMTSFVQTDDSILNRLSTRPIELKTTNITDDELQRMLASTGIPAGLVRTGGRTILARDLAPPPVEDDRG